VEKFRSLFGQETKELTALIKKLEGISKRWSASRRPLDAELDKIKQKLAPSPLDPNRLEKLTKEQTSLKAKLESMKRLEKQGTDKEKLRQTRLKKLRETRYEVFKLRRGQAQDISSRLRGRVRVEVEYKGQVDGFAKELVDLFQGSGIDRKSIEKLSKVEGKVIDGLDIAQAIREGASPLEENFGITSARAGQLTGWAAQDPRRLYELELLSPDDFVQVFLKLEEKESPLERLSDGQRGTAMLLLLLVQVERLLIVDQPEDDLDNRFIYEDIVRILREQKGARQVLVATHNPNIPVLGDAELIVALESSEGRGFIADQGSVDRESVRELVKRIMEGGEDAFRLRAEKYGWGAA